MILALQFTVVIVTLLAVFVAMVSNEDGRAMLAGLAIIGFIVFFAWCLAGVIQHIEERKLPPTSTTQLEKAK